MLGYNGQVPGPVVEVFEGDEVTVHFENQLTESSTIHWHGLHLPFEADGSPFRPVPPGESYDYHFTPAVGSAGTYWYHPHPHARAGHQVAMGLAGALIVRAHDDPLATVPERLLVLTDNRLDSEARIDLPEPKTLAGRIDLEVHSFVNFRASEIRKDFLTVRKIFRAANPDVKFLLTVSPVPLTATASGAHVLPATTYSKSVLRTVAGELAEDFDDIDYFPSFEIVSSHPSAGRFFEPNLRSVKPRGVRRVMRAFLNAHENKPRTKEVRRAQRRALQEDRTADQKAAIAEDVICEEELLEAFRK